jgi:purine-binding chemotaxis protein CheW
MTGKVKSGKRIPPSPEVRLKPGRKIAKGRDPNPASSEPDPAESDFVEDDWIEPPALPEAIASGVGNADLMVFRIAQERFALSLAAVDEAMEAPAWHPVPDSPGQVLGVMRLRGRMVSVCSPADLLGVAMTAERPAVLVLRDASGRVALAVDRIEDVVRIPIADIRKAPGVGDPDGILLGVIHRAGALVAIIDGAALAQACFRTEAEMA